MGVGAESSWLRGAVGGMSSEEVRWFGSKTQELLAVAREDARGWWDPHSSFSRVTLCSCGPGEAVNPRSE